MTDTPSLIKNYSLYVNGKKVGTANGHTYTITSGNASQIGDGQWLGVSQGVTTTGLKSKCIVPFGGKAELRALEDALINKQYIQVGLGVIGSSIHKVSMAVQQAEYDTEMASGSLVGNFDLIGGAPNRVG